MASDQIEDVRVIGRETSLSLDNTVQVPRTGEQARPPAEMYVDFRAS